jgi:hypothetical protein
MSIYERTVLRSQVMSFLLYALLPRSHADEEQGDVFFAMPYSALIIVPKNGMNQIRILSA